MSLPAPLHRTFDLFDLPELIEADGGASGQSLAANLPLVTGAWFA